MVYLETINPKMTQLLNLKSEEVTPISFKYLLLVLVIWALGSLAILTYKSTASTTYKSFIYLCIVGVLILSYLTKDLMGIERLNAMLLLLILVILYLAKDRMGTSIRIVKMLLLLLVILYLTQDYIMILIKKIKQPGLGLEKNTSIRREMQRSRFLFMLFVGLVIFYLTKDYIMSLIKKYIKQPGFTKNTSAKKKV